MWFLVFWLISGLLFNVCEIVDCEIFVKWVMLKEVVFFFINIMICCYDFVVVNLDYYIFIMMCVFWDVVV